MYEKKMPMTFYCGLDIIGEVLYGKWKIRLLYFIDKGSLRPSDLQRKIPDASPRVLFVQLKELEAHGLINRFSFPEVPPRVEYRISELGQTLIPIISALGEWGDKNQDYLRRRIVEAVKK